MKKYEVVNELIVDEVLLQSIKEYERIKSEIVDEMLKKEFIKN